MRNTKYICTFVCVCFVSVVQISETAPSGCVKQKKLCDDHRNCTSGVTACLKKNNDLFTACHPCRCRNPNQCLMVNNIATCVCNPGLTGDYCECPLYSGDVHQPPVGEPPVGQPPVGEPPMGPPQVGPPLVGPPGFGPGFGPGIGPPSACPPNWIQRDTYCYLIETTELKTWNDAKEYCETNFDATLLKVDDMDELGFIRDIVFARGQTNVALITGGRYSNANNDWRWTDDSVIDSSLFNPDTQTPGNCLQYVVSSGSLSTRSCSGSSSFVCKMEIYSFK